MTTDIGEYLVGAYLRVIKECDSIDYNVRPPTGGLQGLGELDVIGLNFKTKTAFLCEVSTHLAGLEYGKGYANSLERVKKKHARQKQYACQYLSNFTHHEFMFWAPRVPKGPLTEGLCENKDLILIINEKYTECVNELRCEAKKTIRDHGNPVFRTLQILEHLRK